MFEAPRQGGWGSLEDMLVDTPSGPFNTLDELVHVRLGCALLGRRRGDYPHITGSRLSTDSHSSSKAHWVNGIGEVDSIASSPVSCSWPRCGFSSPSKWLPTFFPWA